MARPVALLVTLVALALAGSVRIAAQDATPAVGVGVALDPAACRIAPLSGDDLLALMYPKDAAGSPVPAPPAPAIMTAVPAPLGEPADAATVAEVTATVREFMACTNAGDLLRLVTLFSDDLARQAVSAPAGVPEEVVRADVASAPPEYAPRPPAQRVRLIAVTDVAVLSDGRVGAMVIADDPTSPREGAGTVLILFVEEGDRWRLDGFVPFTAVEDAAEATPTEFALPPSQ